jgi:hypothetical protein
MVGIKPKAFIILGHRNGSRRYLPSKVYFNLSIDRRIIFKCVLMKQGLRMWTGFIWLKVGSSGGLF